MAKGKARKRGVQVSKETLAQFKYAQKNGLISKAAKVKGDRVSNKTMEKIALLNKLHAVPRYEPNARTGRLNISSAAETVGIKLPKGRRADSKRADLKVINGLGIVPKGDKRFIEAINRPPGSPTAGVRPLPDAIDDGYESLIELHTGGIHNFRDLFKALRGGKLNGVVKRPDEQWAFTIYNGIPDRSLDTVERLTGKTTGLRTDAELLAYLERYKFITEAARDPSSDEALEEFDAFALYALPAGDRKFMTADVREHHRKRRARERKAAAKLSPKLELLRMRLDARREERQAASAQLHRDTSRTGMTRYRDRLRKELGDAAYKARETEARKKRRSRAD